MRNYHNSAVNQFLSATTGISGSNLPVTVRFSATRGVTPGVKADLFSDDGVSKLDNPVFTDKLGNYNFYVANGYYDLILNEDLASQVIVRDQQIAVVGEVRLEPFVINSFTGTVITLPDEADFVSVHVDGSLLNPNEYTLEVDNITITLIDEITVASEIQVFIDGASVVSAGSIQETRRTHATYTSFNEMLFNTSPTGTTYNLSYINSVSTTQHTANGVGGATYTRDNTTGTASTGDESKFFDAIGNGWIIADDILNPWQFGVTNVSDSHAKFVLMLSVNKPFELFGDFRIDQPVIHQSDWMCAGATDCNIDFSNMAESIFIGEFTGIRVEGSEGVAQVLGSNITVGTNTLTVPDGTKFAVNQVVLIQSDQAFDDAWNGGANNKRGEFLEIESIAVNVLTFKDKTYFSYDSTQNLRITPINSVAAIQPQGLKMIGGGATKGHRGFEVKFGKNVNIDLEVTDFETDAIVINRTYGYTVNGVVSNATLNGAPIGTEGYGVLCASGSRYGNVNVSAYNCRHAVATGGFYPALYANVTGYGVGCGIGTNAFDCHEPTYEFNYDVTTDGGSGGIVIRGINIKAKVKAVNHGSYACRVRDFSGKITTHGLIDLDIESENSGGIAILIEAPKFDAGGVPDPANGNKSPIDKLVVRNVVIKNSTGEGLVASGEIKQIEGGVINIDGMNDAVSSDGSAVRILNNPLTPARPIHINSLTIKNSEQFGLIMKFCDEVTISNLHITDTKKHCAFMEDSSDIQIDAGNLKLIFSGWNPLRTGRCSNIRVGCNLLGLASDPTQDAWRATDCANGTLQSGSQVVADRHAIFNDVGVGTPVADKFVIIGVDASAFTTPFNLAGANNITVNNIV